MHGYTVPLVDNREGEMLMEKYYYALNERFNFNVQRNMVVITDTYLKTQFSLSGEMTSKILIPIILKSERFITIDGIKKLTNENIDDIKNTLEKLLDREFIIKYEQGTLIDTENLPAAVGNFNGNVEIIVVTDFYMSQLFLLEEAFLSVKGVKFKYIFINFDEELFRKVSMLKVKNKHNNVYRESKNFRQLISESPNSLIVSLRYGNLENSRVDSINKIIEDHASKSNISVLYGFLNVKSFAVGPLYIPKKTATLNDFILCNNTLPKSNKENFSINQLLSITMIALLINEINWYLFKNVSPLLIDTIRYYSKTLKCEEIHLYRH